MNYYQIINKSLAVKYVSVPLIDDLGDIPMQGL